MRRKSNISSTVSQAVLLIAINSIHQRQNQSTVSKRSKPYKRNCKFKHKFLKRRYRIEEWFQRQQEIIRKLYRIKKMFHLIRMNIFLDFYLFLFFAYFLDSFESYEPIILNLNNLFSSIVIKMRQNNPNPESTQKPY